IEPAHRIFERTPVETGEGRSDRARERSWRGGHKSHPAQLPTLGRKAVKGVQNMGRCKAGVTRRMCKPAPIEKGMSFPTETYLHKGATQVRAHNGVGGRRIHHRHMGDVPGGQRIAMLRSDCEHMCVITEHMGLGEDIRPAWVLCLF